MPLGGILCGGAASSAVGAIVFAVIGRAIDPSPSTILLASLAGAAVGSVVGWCVARLCVSLDIIGPPRSTLMQ
ncbi:MAG: hypothetical protein ACE5ED_08475 [Rhodothalassiaceae bacterium]